MSCWQETLKSIPDEGLGWSSADMFQQPIVMQRHALFIRPTISLAQHNITHRMTQVNDTLAHSHTLISILPQTCHFTNVRTQQHPLHLLASCTHGKKLPYALASSAGTATGEEILVVYDSRTATYIFQPVQQCNIGRDTTQPATIPSKQVSAYSPPRNCHPQVAFCTQKNVALRQTSRPSNIRCCWL